MTGKERHIWLSQIKRIQGIERQQREEETMAQVNSIIENKEKPC